jgi:hypothetical protein
VLSLSWKRLLEAPAAWPACWPPLGHSSLVRGAVQMPIPSRRGKVFYFPGHSVRKHMADRQSAYLPERVPYSDLPETTAAHYPAHEGLQPEQAGKIPWMQSQGRWPHEEKEFAQAQAHNASSSEREKSRKCGLAPWLFWTLLAAVIVVVVIAAVVGGVVGSQHGSGNDKSSTGAAAAQSAGTRTQTSSHTSSASKTTTSPALSTHTLYVGDRPIYRDCPSSNDTVYTYGGSGAPMYFRKWCGLSCYNTQGWTAMINQDTDSLDDCIDLCASYNLLLNQTQIISNSSSAGHSVCNSVCWRWSPRDPDWPGHCFGFTAGNVSGHFNLSSEAICDSAGWMNQYF